MPIQVRLPPDTEYFRIGEIPALLARERYPELPPDAPRRVTELKKYPLDDETRREHGVTGGMITFGVTLTDADWIVLQSIWAGLPPLRLPIPEDEWHPYQEAFDAAKVGSWRLDVRMVNDVMDRLEQRQTTADNLKKELQRAAEAREITPLCRVSYTPIDCTSGELFLDSFLAVRDLASFAERYGFMVDMATGDGQDVPTNGSERYTLNDAALLINEAGNRNIDKQDVIDGKDTTVKALKASAWSGELPTYAPGETVRWRYGDDAIKVVRGFYEEATASDLNKWLDVHESKLAKLWRFQVYPTLTESHGSRLDSQEDLTPAQRRGDLDITTQRGFRRRILENWSAIEKEFGPDADGRQVLRVLNRDKDEKKPALKTVQNHLIDLRKERLIP